MVCSTHGLLQVYNKSIFYARQPSFDHYAYLPRAKCQHTLQSLLKVNRLSDGKQVNNKKIGHVRKAVLSPQYTELRRTLQRKLIPGVVVLIEVRISDLGRTPACEGCLNYTTNLRNGGSGFNLLEKIVFWCHSPFRRSIRRYKVCHAIAIMRILFCRSPNSPGLAVDSSLSALDLQKCDQPDRL